MHELVKKGHTVYVETDAGKKAGFDDNMYLRAGAIIAADSREVFASAELIVKVKEPLPEEYPLIKSHHTVFTYFHFASSLELTEAMLKSGATCIAYETVTYKDGSLPLLIPMSQVAGRLAAQLSAHYLLHPNHGKGKLIGGVPGTSPANVLVLGGGIVGTEAARISAGMGANVTILDVNAKRLNWLSENMPKNINALFSTSDNIERLLPTVDIVIGAVLIPGGKAPKLINESMLSLIREGSVLLDVAVDQGGCIETVEVTSHEKPITLKGGIVHYGVPNMPGAVPITSTEALSSVTLPYLIQLAEQGWQAATDQNPGFKSAVNIIGGKVVYDQLIKDLNL